MGNLDHLWAGWRSEYIAGAAGDAGPEASTAVATASDRAGDEPKCVFCRILASSLADEETHIVWRHPQGLALAILNAYPYTSGHLMVMPVRHVGELEALEHDEASHVWDGVKAGVKALKSAYKPEGVNVGANLGRAAGAGVPGHFHMHIVARWAGDTNFMTSVADARVLPEPLSVSGAKLRACWPSDS